MNGQGEEEEEKDLNRLHTALSRAIETEEYSQAASLRDKIATVTGQDTDARGGGWGKLGVPDWLADRAERMGFLMPTQVQRNSLGAIQQVCACVCACGSSTSKFSLLS